MTGGRPGGRLGASAPDGGGDANRAARRRAATERRRAATARARAEHAPAADGRQGQRSEARRPLSSLVGREGDVAAVSDLLATCRLLTLCGAPGVGKTRLALEVAARRRQDTNAVWVVDLASVVEGDLVAVTVLSEMVQAGGAVPEGPARADVAPARLVERLGDRRALLVLDNCEHLIAGCAALARELLAGCANLAVLVTSRQPLALDGERVRDVRPLPVPGASDIDSASLAANEAVQLFAARAAATSPGFVLDVEVAPAVAEICRRLDGMPLALELAAARLPVLSAPEIASRLDERFRLLTGDGRPGSGRHRSLEAAIAWSHDLLSAPEAVLFRRLSVFAGGWSLPAAEEVCACEPLAAEDVLDLLGALVRKSLVLAQRSGGVTRYRMLESITHYARARLEDAGEAGALAARHAAWCVSRAEEAEPGRQGRAHEAWLDRLEPDHGNFRAALAWACETGSADVALRLAGALAWFWQTRGHLREGRRWLSAALAVSGGSAGPRAKALRAAGLFDGTLGDLSSGLAFLDRSATAFHSVGDDEEAEGCVCRSVFQMCGNPLHSLPALERHVDRIRRTGDANRLAHALTTCGQAHFFRGDAAGARRRFAEALDLGSAAIDGDAVDSALFGLARVALMVGDYAAAEAPLYEVLSHAQRVGDADGRSSTLCLMGELARARGDHHRAAALLADAMELAGETGSDVALARSEYHLARLAYSEGDHSAARALYAKALGRGGGAAPMAHHQVRCLLGLAEAAAARGEGARAETLFGEAQDQAEATGDRQATARTLAGRAELARTRGDLGAAAGLHHRSLELAHEIGELAAVTRSLECVAGLGALAGRPEASARLFGAAAALRERHGLARVALEQPTYDDDVAFARAGLGDEGWDALSLQGSQLSVDEAVSLAGRGRGERRRPASGWESLTKAEHQVARLVAQGLTNPEVGERLFISRRTVGHHLSHIYAKLGITSRRQLARVAGRPPGS